MAEHHGTDRIFIGNLGRYNDGDIIGEWLDLPFGEAGLPKWLEVHAGVDELHEEVFIMDTDLEGPLGDLGADVGEWADLHHVNLASKCAGELSPRQLEAARQWADVAGEHGLVALCNFMLQADEIPYMRLDGVLLDYSSQEERLAYTVLGGLSGVSDLSDAELEKHFDYEDFGRLLDDEGMYLGERGFLDPSYAQDLDLERYGASEIVDMSGNLRWGPSSLAGDPTSEDAFIASFGILASEVHAARESDPALCSAVASYLEGMDERDSEALHLFADAMMDSSQGPLELVNCALDLSNAGYREYTASGCTAHERCARTYIEECGMPAREELERHLDMTSYGHSLISEGDIVFTSDGEGCIDLAAGDIDPALYTIQEIGDMFSADCDLRLDEMAASAHEASCSLEADVWAAPDSIGAR